MTVTREQVLEAVKQSLEYFEMKRIGMADNTKKINVICNFYNEVNHYLQENLK